MNRPITYRTFSQLRPVGPGELLSQLASMHGTFDREPKFQGDPVAAELIVRGRTILKNERPVPEATLRAVCFESRGLIGGLNGGTYPLQVWLNYRSERMKTTGWDVHDLIDRLRFNGKKLELERFSKNRFPPLGHIARNAFLNGALQDDADLNESNLTGVKRIARAWAMSILQYWNKPADDGLHDWSFQNGSRFREQWNLESQMATAGRLPSFAFRLYPESLDIDLLLYARGWLQGHGLRIDQWGMQRTASRVRKEIPTIMRDTIRRRDLHRPATELQRLIEEGRRSQFS